MSEKHQGQIALQEVATIAITDLRVGGPEVVTSILQQICNRQVCVVNAATYRDLEVFVAGLLPAEAEAVLGAPVVRHGLQANGRTIELAAKYSNEQGLTPRRLVLSEIFHPSTLDE